MAMVCGKKDQEIMINMKDNMQMTRNQDMEYSLGKQEMFTKDIMKQM
jgi:hypothetical protein